MKFVSKIEDLILIITSFLTRSVFTFDDYAVCNHGLGMKSYGIEDYQLSSAEYLVASGTYFQASNSRKDSPAFNAIINGRESSYFIFNTGFAEKWIQIDLMVTHQIAGLQTQGAIVSSTAYVTGLFLKYSEDMNTWKWHNDHLGNKKLLSTNIAWNYLSPDGTTAYMQIYPTILARGIRLYLHSHHISPDFRMELLGCTEDVIKYNHYKVVENGLSVNTIGNGAILLIDLPHAYTITSLVLQINSVATYNNASVNVYYKKSNTEANWRGIAVFNHTVTSSELVINLAAAIKALKLKVECDKQNIICNGVSQVSGEQMKGCPQDYVQQGEYCYSHLPYAQTMNNDQERRICERAFWGGENIYMAFPTSVDELYFFKEISYRSDPQQMHLGLFRNGNYQGWYTLNGQNFSSYFWTHSPIQYNKFCADLNGLVTTDYCHHARPFTCKTKVLEPSKYKYCEWFSIKRDTILDTSDKLVLVGYELTSCMYECQRREDVNCSSIEWNEDKNECHLNKIHSDTLGIAWKHESKTDLFDIYCFKDADCLKPLLSINGTKASNVKFYATSTATDTTLNNITLDNFNYPNGGNYWYCTSCTYFQVEWTQGFAAKIHKLVIMGATYKYDAFVKKFLLLYSNTTQYWKVYTDGATGLQKEFQSMWDRYSMAKHVLKPPIVTKYVRIEIRSHHYRPALKMELYGCVINEAETNYNSLGMGSYRERDIENNQLTSEAMVIQGGAYYPPWQARYENDGNIMIGREKTFWAGGAYQLGQWYQVDFLTPHEVRGFAAKGGGDHDAIFFTTLFKIKYSLTSPAKFDFVLDENGSEKKFSGSFHKDVGVYNDFGKLVKARYLRVLQMQFSINTHQRYEFYGYPSMADCPEIQSNQITDVFNDPANGCSCNSVSGNAVCTLNTQSTLQLKFNTMYLMHGIEMIWELATGNDVLGNVTVQYFHGGNKTWSNMHYKVDKQNDSSILYRATRICRATMIKVSLPSTTNHNCVSVRVFGHETSACPPGFVQYRRKCFAIPEYSVIQMWHETKQQFHWDMIGLCSNMSWNGTAVMASVSNIEEESFVHHLNYRSGGTIFDGFFAPNMSIPSPFEWKWMDGNPSSWVIWRPGDPHESRSTYNPDRCTGKQVDDLRRMDFYCTDWYRYICNVNALDISNRNAQQKEWSILRNYREINYLQDFVIEKHSISQCLSLCEREVISNCSGVLHYHTGKKCYFSVKTVTSGQFAADGSFDFYQLHKWDDNCMSPLVWPNYPGQVEVTSSTNRDASTTIIYADINNLVSSWWPSINNGFQFIHVDFHAIAKIVKVAIRGNENYYFIKKYRLMYTNDTRWWEVYKDGRGEDMIFAGNDNTFVVNKVFLTPPIIARFVRIQATDWHYHICMKFEFYGCLIYKDNTKHCSILSRSSGRHPYHNDHRFSYIDVNGHPYVSFLYPSQPRYRGHHLLTLDEDTCHADLISSHDLLVDVTNNNNHFRNRLGLLKNGTQFFGITSDHGAYVDTQSADLLESMGLGVLVNNWKSVTHRANAFYLNIGEKESVQIEWTEVHKSPAFLLRQIRDRQPNDYSLSSRVLPVALGHWPFSSGLSDISDNLFHFQTISGKVQIKKDQGCWNHGYAYFDGSSSLRVEVTNKLQLSGEFTVFFAINPEQDGPLLLFHDDLSTNYATYFSIWLSNYAQDMVLYTSTGTNSVIDGTKQIAKHAWNFIAFTYDNQTNILRFWKDGRVHSDSVVSNGFSVSTVRRYVTLGADRNIRWKGKFSCLQFYDRKLTTLYIGKLIQVCRKQNDIFKGLSSVTEENEIQGPLGMMDGTITESQTSVASIYYAAIGEYHKDSARLYKYAKGFTDRGCWVGTSTLTQIKSDWFQIDLGILHKVTAVVTKGCPIGDFYSTHLLIEYAKSDNIWSTIITDTETNNKTVAANFDWHLAVKSTLPYPVYAQYLKFWLHTSVSRNSAQFEIIGKPVDMPALIVGDVKKIKVKSSSICPRMTLQTEIPIDVNGITNCDVCLSSHQNIWWEYDLSTIFYITSIEVFARNSSGNTQLELRFEKRFFDTLNWQILSEPLVQQKRINGTQHIYTYMMIPVLRTRYLKIHLIKGNLSCLTLNIYGEPAPVCPPGSIMMHKKCFTLSHKALAKDAYVLPQSEKACTYYSWATTGRTVIPKHRDIVHLFTHILHSYKPKLPSIKIGIQLSGTKQTASWMDGTTANGLLWKAGYPRTSATTAYLQNAQYWDTESSRVVDSFACETMSSAWGPNSEQLRLTLTAVSSYSLYLDGIFIGERKWWNYPWIIDINSDTKVIAVEMSVDVGANPGFLAYISDGTISDSSWKCTTNWEKYWTTSKFNDSHWQNATEIEPHSSGNRVLQYGFDQTAQDPYWIWTQNYNSPKDLHVYCRKTRGVSNNETSDSQYSHRWGFMYKRCIPSVYDWTVNTYTAIECMSLCERNASCGSVDFYEDKTPSCYLRSQTRADLPNGIITFADKCHFFERWFSECSTFLIKSLYPQNLVKLEASTSTAPVSQAILDNFNHDTRTYLYWYTTTVNPYQWIKATFTDIVNITAITTVGVGYVMSKYYVFYVDPISNNYKDVRDVAGNRREFLGFLDKTQTYSSNVLKDTIVTNTIMINPVEWNTYISINFDVQGCVLKEFEPPVVEYWRLGMISGHISVSQITASSTYDSSYSPNYARLLNQPKLPNNIGCWRPKDQPYEFMVDLLTNHYIHSVEIQGCPGVGHFITQLHLRYSLDGIDWQKIYKEDGNTERVFDGSYFSGDFTTTAVIPNGPVQGRHVQLIIIAYEGSYPGLRMEIYGKPVDCDRIYFPIISKSGSAGIASYEIDNAYPKSEITPIQDSWCPNVDIPLNQDKPVVMIMLNSLYLTTSIKLLNATGIVSIEFEYSSDTRTWHTYIDEQKNTTILDIEGKGLLSLQRLVKVKAIRISIISWKTSQPCLQLVLHACKANNCLPNTISHEDKCYYKDDLIKGSYSELLSHCHNLHWSGKGSLVMPKDWRQFDFVESVTNPDRRHLQNYYVGLTKSSNIFTWADNETIMDNSVLPFSNSPTLECVQYGSPVERFTSVSCSLTLSLFCEVQSSGSSDATNLWLHRWNVLLSTAGNSFTSGSVFDCMNICLNNKSITCKSIVFSHTTKVCKVLENTLTNTTVTNIVSDQSWIYHEHYLKESCEVNILAENISLSSIVASSIFNMDHNSTNAIFDKSFLSTPVKYWRASDSDLVKPWVKVVFNQYVIVKRILTAGAVTSAYWPTEITIMSSHNGLWFRHYYNDPAITSNKAVTYGTSLTQTLMADTPLLYPFLARSLQITLKSYAGKPVIRFTIYGCAVGDNYTPTCFKGLGLQQRLLKASQLSSSSIKVNPDGKWYGPFNAGLDATDDKNDLAGWIPQPSTDTSTSFIQIDFEIPHKITYVVTQGINSNYVTLFDVHYSTNRITWMTRRTDNTTMSYPGSLEKILHLLSPNIIASSLRIFPRGFSGEISLRLEVVGCLEDCPTFTPSIYNDTSTVKPCIYDGSLNCETWCPATDGSLTINVTLGEQHHVTGFTLYSINFIYDSIYDVKIKDNQIHYYNIYDATQNVLSVENFINKTGSRWKWTLVYPVIVKSLQMKLSMSDNSQCLHVQLTACTLEACPVGFTQFKDQCYYFRDEPYSTNYKSRSYDDAASICAKMSWGDIGRLSIPTSTEMNYFLQNLASSDTAAFFMGIKYNTTSLEYEDMSTSTPVAYSHWFKDGSHPNQVTGHCVKMVNGFWESSACDNGNVMCQTKAKGIDNLEWIAIKNIKVQHVLPYRVASQVIYISSCLKFCQQEPCKSVEYNTTSKECRLYTQSRYIAPMILSSGTNLYFEKLKTDTCNLDLFKLMSYTSTSSSNVDANRQAYMINMDKYSSSSSGGFWQPSSNDVNQWIRVMFEIEVSISRLVLIGSDYKTGTAMVSKFKFESSVDAVTWKTIKNDISSSEIFEAYTGDHGLSQFLFHTQPSGFTFRIIPLTWITAIALKMKLYGCITFDHLTSCATQNIPTVYHAELPQPRNLSCYYGWNIISHHTKGKTSFNTDWQNYRLGFQYDNETEYFIGNIILDILTRKNSHLLRVDIWENDNQFIYSEFDSFSVKSKELNYTLELQNFVGGSAGTGGLLLDSGSVFSLGYNQSACSIESVGGFWHASKQFCQRTLLTSYPKILWKSEALNKLIEVQNVIMRIKPKLEIVNIAIGKTTAQSSTSNLYKSSKAVDGYIFTDLVKGFCALTNVQDNPFWIVDLGKQFYIKHVIITAANGRYLHDFDVKLSKTEDNLNQPNLTKYTTCQHYIGTVPPGSTTKINCSVILLAQFVAIQINGLNEVLALCEVEVFPVEKTSHLSEMCGWDQDCITEFAQCLPVDVSSRQLNFTCQCQPYYIAEEELCKPLIDITLAVNISGKENAIVRGLSSNINITIDIFNSDPRQLLSNRNYSNFELVLSITDQDIGTNNTNLQLSGFSYIYLHGSSLEGVAANGSINWFLKYEIFVTPAKCPFIKYICMEIRRSVNASYFERDNKNNIMCVEVKDITICKPDADVSIVSSNFIGHQNIIRDTSKEYEFSLAIAFISGKYPIVTLQGDNVNFVIWYSLSSQSYNNGSYFKETIGTNAMVVSTLNKIDAQKSLSISHQLTFSTGALISFDFNACNVTDYICFLVSNDNTSSYNEIDFSNNMKCVDIRPNKVCNPEIPLSVPLVQLSNLKEFIRGYNSTADINFHLKNNDVNLPVSSTADPHANFNVSLYIAEKDLQFGEKAQSMLLFIESLDIPKTEIQQGIPSNQFAHMHAKALVLIPRIFCDKFSYLCIEVLPLETATYQLYPGNQHIGCTNITTYIDCIGKAASNVTFEATPHIAPVNATINLSVSWSEGTDIEYEIDFGDASPLYRWKWLVANHKYNYGPLSTILQHKYLEIGNYTVQLKIWNDVSREIKYISIIVEPYLDKYLTFKTLYEPNYVPVHVQFAVYHVHKHLNVPIWVECNIDYGESGVVGDTFNIIVQDKHIFTHTYVKDEPNVNASIQCNNPVSNISYKSFIILRQNITGLNITTEYPAYATSTNVTILVTMNTGSHVILAVNFGDGNKKFFKKSNIYSSNFTWNMQHLYGSNGNYSINVTASNEHFTQFISLKDLLFIQNPVPQISLSSSNNSISFPPGFVDFTLTPLTTHYMPDNVYCKWQFSPFKYELSYSNALVSGESEIKKYVYGRNDIGYPLNVSVTCYNLVSRKNAFTSFQVYEVLSNLNVLVDSHFVAPYQNVCVNIAVSNGSNVKYQIDFSDRKKEVINSQSIFAVKSPMKKCHHYNTTGNYSLNVSSSNEVSKLDHYREVKIIVQNFITNLTLSANKSVLWPTGQVDFIIEAGIGQLLLDNIHCDWTYAESLTERTFIPSVSSSQNVKHTFTFPRSAVGLANVTMNCSNLISWISNNSSIEIILDEVILDSLVTDDWLWWTNTSKFNLSIARFGTYSCFEWDMGDNTKFIYGVAWCQASATAKGLELILIDHGIYFLPHNYTYNHWGIFNVHVFAFNHISNDTLNTVAVIKDWYCYYPNISFAQNLTLSSKPHAFRKSLDFVIAPESISIDCMKSRNRSVSVFSILNSMDIGSGPVYKVENVTSFHHPKRLLPYGTYMGILRIEMLGVPHIFSEEKVYFEIVKTPLIIEIKGSTNVTVNFNKIIKIDAWLASFDPDVEPTVSQNIAFQWTCRQQTEILLTKADGSALDAGPPDPTKISYETFNGCFGGGPGKLPDSNGTLSVNTGLMMPNKIYIFEVKGYKDTRSGIAEIHVSIIPPVAPNISITCIENCGSRRRQTGAIILQALCTDNCETKFGGTQHYWELEWLNDTTGEITVYRNLIDITTGGIQSNTLHINPSTLKGGVNHKARVTSSTPGSYKSVVEYNFLTNLPPFGGKCKVFPLEGIAAKTFFEFTCEGWQEWKGSLNGRLKYEYRVRSIGSERSFLVYYGFSMTSDPSQLPMGNYLISFKNEMELFIYDKLGDYYRLIVNVTVLPEARPKLAVASDFEKQIISKDSNLSKAFQSGNYQTVSSTVFSMTSIINLPANFDLGLNVTEDIQQVTNVRKSIRKNCIDMIAQIPVTTSDGLLQTNDVIRALLLPPHEIVVDAMGTASNKVDSMAEFFINTRGNVSKTIYKQISTDLASSSVRVMIAGDIAVKESQVSQQAENNITTTYAPTTTKKPSNSSNSFSVKNKVGTVMKTVVKTITKITTTILTDKKVGESDDVIDLHDVTLIVGKQTGSKLSNSSYTNRQGKLLLPDLQLLLPGTTGECVGSNVMFSSINPFIYGPGETDNNINSPVVEFTLDDCSSSSKRVKRSLKTEYEVELEVSNSGDPISVNESVTDIHGMIYHSINVSQDKPVIISVYPSGNDSLEVYVNINHKPTLQQYSNSFTSPKGNDSTIEQGTYELDRSLYLSPDNLTDNNATSVFIGVKKNGCRPQKQCTHQTPGNNIIYTYRLSEIQCQSWDTVTETWSSSGCKIQTGSTPTKVKFKSNLFGSMGAGVFVGPNMIDFGTVFNNLGQKIAENAAVFGTVIAVIVLYIPLIVLCRIFDKKDKQKWMILPLVDNYQEDGYSYEVHIYTGLKSNAEINSNVSMVLAGTKADTGIRPLVDGKRKNFQRGDVTSFLLKTSDFLGIPVALKIWHDNSGTGKMASWYLSKVIIVDLQDNKWYLFMCEDWLSTEESDGQIERLLKLASSDELSEKSGNMLQNNIKKKLFDDHIWVSIGYRKTRSSFTRVQRLSCCLSILFLTMVSNAMWFGTGNTESSQAAFTVGPISFTVHQLYTSVMSSLIIVPPILVITVLFSKSKEKIVKSGNADNFSAMDRHELKRKKKLPHWCIYIAYVLVFLSVAAGAFFTILYAFQWGKQKSTDWLVTFLLSFVQSVMIIQPIKVIAVAILITFMFKKDSDTEDYEESYGHMEERKESLSPANLDILTSTMHMSEEEIQAARKRKLIDIKMNSMIKEIVWQTIFLVILLFVVVGNQDSNVYRQNQDLRNAYMGNIQMQSRYELWDWFKEEMLPSLYFTEYNNLNPVNNYDKRFISNTYSMRLGPARIRQLRIHKEHCTVPIEVLGYVNRCTKQYTEYLEDQRNYNDNWNDFINNSIQINSEKNDAFRYISPKEMDGIKYWGKFGWYPSGGYVVNLGNTINEAQSTLTSLEEKNWIDQYTSVIFVEFNVWNANTNLFNMFILSLELLPFGGVVTWNTIDSLQLYRYAGPGGLINLLAELILVIVVFVFTIVKIVKMVKNKCNSFLTFWNLLEIVSLFLFYSGLAMYAWRSVLTATTIEKMMNNKGKLINFQMLVLINTFFMNLLSIMTFLVMVRLVHILRYNQTISIMGATIAKSSEYLFGMLVSFGIIFIAFTILCFTLFGTKMMEYSTVSSTMSALSEAFLGKFDFHSVTEANGLIGGFVLFSYLLIMMLLIMNLFVSIFNEFLAAVQGDKESLPKDHEVIDHFIHILHSLFGTKKIKPDAGKNVVKDQPLSEESVTKLCQRIEGITNLAAEHPVSSAVTDFLKDFYDWKYQHPGNMEVNKFLMQKASESNIDNNIDDLVMLALKKYYLPNNN